MPSFDPQRLRSVRLARGFTADQAAVAAGRTTSAYYKYERGEIAPTLASLCRLADVLGCEVGELFSGHPHRSATATP
jgi:transcriptional regulator with XRE-family HTH domain